MITGQKHPPPKVIAIDVDGTLLINGARNARLIECITARKAEGFVLHLWSSRGEAHALRQGIRDRTSVLSDLFEAWLRRR